MPRVLPWAVLRTREENEGKLFTKQSSVPRKSSQFKKNISSVMLWRGSLRCLTVYGQASRAATCWPVPGWPCCHVLVRVATCWSVPGWAVLARPGSHFRLSGRPTVAACHGVSRSSPTPRLLPHVPRVSLSCHHCHFMLHKHMLYSCYAKGSLVLPPVMIFYDRVVCQSRNYHLCHP